MTISPNYPGRARTPGCEDLRLYLDETRNLPPGRYEVVLRELVENTNVSENVSTIANAILGDTERTNGPVRDNSTPKLM